MNTSLDKTIREALHELDRLKSPDCLDDAALGCYAENQVTSIGTCLNENYIYEMQ